jgi:hypothetical protein
MVGLNRAVMSNTAAPFGAVKASGYQPDQPADVERGVQRTARGQLREPRCAPDPPRPPGEANQWQSLG